MTSAGIVEATRSYERWMGEHLTVVAGDLKYKHRMMAADPFSFMRATYYRWLELWPATCPELARATPLLAVGDVHVENFGTWRDTEGRLVWGINDFDEASRVSFTNDLVRLGVSALLATRGNHLRITLGDACQAILAGYRDCIGGAGLPFVLGERDHWLRDQAMSEQREPARYWARMNAMPAARAVPGAARKAMAKTLPEGTEVEGLRTRRAGMGSLGRPRFVLLGRLHGAELAREAKALLPPAAAWAHGDADTPLMYQAILGRAVRCPDPYLLVKNGWVIRRLAPDCSRVELADLPVERDEARLLWAMGWETANVHLGSPKAVASIRRDLANLDQAWLPKGARRMARALTAEWKEWRRSRSH